MWVYYTYRLFNYGSLVHGLHDSRVPNGISIQRLLLPYVRSVRHHLLVQGFPRHTQWIYEQIWRLCFETKESTPNVCKTSLLSYRIADNTQDFVRVDLGFLNILWELTCFSRNKK